MVKKSHILLGVLAVCAVGVLVWLASRAPSEPVYQGKRLSDWLHGYDNGAQNRTATDEAVRNMGTKAIPFLLQRLRENDSAQASDCHLEAIGAFKILGASASNAVPELIQLYTRNISMGGVSVSLGSIGPAASDAVPVLLACACSDQRPHSTDESEMGGPQSDAVRAFAFYALGQIHSRPETVVPALMELLRHRPVDNIQFTAAVTLAEFGSDAKPAVPLLIKYYDDPGVRKSMKADIGNAIKKIDPEAASKVGVQ